MTKITLVTGANRGLGCAAAVSIAASGRDVVVAYRSNVQQAEEVVAEIEALGHQAIALPLDMAEIARFPPSPRPCATPCTPTGSATASMPW